MIAKVVKKIHLHDSDQQKKDREYWLSQSPESRLSAVEFMRKQFYAEYPERLYRVYRVIKQT